MPEPTPNPLSTAEPAVIVADLGHRANTPTTGDMLNALERAIARLDREADQLADAQDYGAEFPASDAEALREVVKVLGGDRTSRVQFRRTPDPMEAPLPCQVQIGHMGFGKGVALRSLVEHCKRMYRLVHGQDADEVANEPLEVRRARGDAFLERVRARRLATASHVIQHDGATGVIAQNPDLETSHF